MENEFPNHVNFYATFKSPTKKLLKELLERKRWKIRKENWNDFECTTEWAAMNLLGDENNVLLHGIIVNPRDN